MIYLSAMNQVGDGELRDGFSRHIGDVNRGEMILLDCTPHTATIALWAQVEQPCSCRATTGRPKSSSKSAQMPE